MPIWSPAFFGSATSSGYVIEGSGSYNGTDGELTRTISSAGNRRTFILEVIFKRGSTQSSFLTAYSSGTDVFYFYLSGGQVYVQNYIGANQIELKSDARLRDFSAWYHLIVAIDTTQSTEADRVKAWVNGVELTWASSPQTYPALDFETKWNTGSQEHQIGHSSTTYSSDYFARAASYDGAIMTDPVTDGFGEYDDNGVWVPKNPSNLSSLTGRSLISQGTGSVIGTMNVRTSAAFDGNNNQDENNAASHNFAATTVTLGKDFGSGNAKVVNQVKAWGYSGGGFTSNASENCTITVIGSNTGLGSDEVTLATSGTISDTTDSNPQIISFSNSTAYRYVYIKLTQSPSNYFFVAELEFYEKVTVGFGTTGFLIEGGAAFTNGTDSSGNSQNFTKGGTITDVDDTLTDKASDNFGNYPTWSQMDKDSNVSLSLGSTVAEQDSNSSFKNVFATQVVPSSGKWVWEIKQSGGSPFAGYATTGVASVHVDRTIGRSGAGAITFDYQTSSNKIRKFGGGSTEADYATSVSMSSGEAFQFAIDSDAEELKIFVNNTQEGSTLDISSLTKPYKIISQIASGGTVDHTLVTNSTDFENNVPTGYKIINTANLPAPTVTKPDDFFNTVLYTGNGSSRTISGVGFQPDWVWIKDRNVGENHYSFDAVRGAEKRVHQNTDDAEGTESTALTGFVSDGFTLGNGSAGANTNTRTYVAFCWKAGDSNTSVSSSGSGSGATNACTHRANTTSGLSVIKYTGFNSTISNGEHTLVTHGLGSAPVFMMGRSLDSTQDWFCLPGENDPSGSGRWGLDNHMHLNTSDDSSGALHVQPAFPTSTAVKLGNDDLVNKNGDEFIMYAWIRVPGMVAYGTYTGNSSAEGPMVVVDDGGSGFRPAWLLIKRITANENWMLFNSKSDVDNPAEHYLLADGSNTENDGTGGNDVDFIANGFKLRSLNAGTNSSGTYMYLAMAEHPFGGDGVAQAKGRP